MACGSAVTMGPGTDLFGKGFNEAGFTIRGAGRLASTSTNCGLS